MAFLRKTALCLLLSACTTQSSAIPTDGTDGTDAVGESSDATTVAESTSTRTDDGSTDDGSTAADESTSGAGSETTTEDGDELSSSSVTGGSDEPFCGNGKVEEGEACDDESPQCSYCMPATQWSTGTITYTSESATVVMPVGSCYYCDATLSSGHALLRFQVGDGYTLWQIYFDEDISQGEHVLSTYGSPSVYLTDNSDTLPAALRGGYQVETGTVTFTSFDVRDGGLVAGTVDAVLRNIEDADGATAHLEVEFYAEFPE